AIFPILTSSTSRGWIAGHGIPAAGSRMRAHDGDAMLIGAMNHPAHDVLSEIEWMAGMGLGFIDLTLEPPAAASWRIDAAAVRRAIESCRLKVVGHTPFYLPLGSAI